MISIVFMCNVCNESYTVRVKDEDVDKFTGVELIQIAIPHLTPNVKELQFSGICGICGESFDEMSSK